MDRTTTISDAWGAFRTERAISLNATSLSTDYMQVQRWLERCPVQELDRGREALTWVLQQEPVQSARRVGMYVKSLYRWAASEDVGLIRRNPVASLRFPKAPQRDEEIIVIPREEVPVVLGGLATGSKRVPCWQLWAEFQLQTGLRTGEVRAVHVEDVQRDGRLLVHRNFTLTHGLKSSTKTNKKRLVPLNATARELVARLKSTAVDGFLFPWNRNSFQSFFNERMTSLREQGAITHRYRPYDLRHTAISHWLEAGIPVTQVAAWAGNTPKVIWEHYANTTGDYQMPEL